MIKHLFITLFVCFTLVQANAQDVKELTLQDAINYAMDNNTNLKIAQINIADASEQIIERRSIGLPIISAGVNYQYAVKLPVSLIPARFFDPTAGEDELAEVQFGTRNNLVADLNLDLLLFDASYLTGLKAARSYKEYVKEELKQKQYEVKHMVIEAYMPSLILEESKVILDKNIANLEKLLAETQALYKEGFVEQLDVDRLELSLSNLNTEDENLDRQSELVYNVLKFQMGYPMDAEIVAVDDIETLFTPATDAELTASLNYSDRPEYRVLQLGKYLNELNVQFNRSGYLPNLSAFGSYSQIAQGDNIFDEPIWTPTSFVGLQLNVPIFDGFLKRAKVNRAKLELEIVEKQETELERSISLEVANARTNYRSALERYQDRQKNMELAEKIYNTTQIKYREGVGSSIEITQAEQSLYTTQQNYVQSRYELLLAKMQLEKALGK